jgi:hypothetical protein
MVDSSFVVQVTRADEKRSRDGHNNRKVRCFGKKKKQLCDKTNKQ